MMRKFISLMSAAAVLASVAVVPISASAEDAFTYDGSGVSSWSDATDSRINAAVITDEDGDYTKITTSGNGSGRIYYNLPAEAQLNDNYVIEYDVNISKANGMGRLNQYNQVAFIADGAVLDNNGDNSNKYGDYATAVDFGSKTNDQSGQGYISGVASSVTSIYGMASSLINFDGAADKLVPSDEEAGMLSKAWYRVQATVAGGKVAIKAIDNSGAEIVSGEYDAPSSALKQISVAVGRGDDDEGSGVVLLDNIRVYSGAAETLSTDGLRGEAKECTVSFVVDDAEYETKTVLSGNGLKDIPDVPEKAGYIGKWVLDDGTAFTSATVITDDTTVTAEYALAVDAVAKAATIVTESGELRISEKTAGAVFRFETKDLVPEGKTIKKAELIVKAAPRSYKESDTRFENAEIWTIKVNSNWNSESNEITADAWNNLSKGDAFDKQYTAKYPSADPNAVPPYQTLNAIDVTDKINEDGVAVFAFKTGSAREHAIDATLALTFDEGGASPSTEGIEIPASVRAATKVEGDELRISDGTNGAFFKFVTGDLELSEGQYIQKAELIIKAAPRSYKADSNRFESTSIMTYKVGSTWSGEGSEITNDDWNALSKGDPINTQNTANYPTADSTAVPPYQTLKSIDVTDMLGTDGVTAFAFKTGSAREHAIDVYLVITVGERDTNDTAVEAAAKASTKVEGDEFRISDGTNGAVYKFDINDMTPEREKIVSVQLYVEAAPRSYKADSNRFESTSIMTYKVGSTWSGEGSEITNDDWNALSKGDPINTQDTANYPTADSAAVAPYQTLKPIDVTDMFTDGVATFAFKTGSAREHAVNAYVVVTTAKNVWTKYAVTKDANGVLTNVTMTTVDDPVTVGLGTNEYLWNQFQVPYAQAD